MDKIKLDFNAIKWEEFFYYDETSPTFLRWKVDRWSGEYKSVLRKSAGDIAGCISRGYAQLGFLGKIYRNHRIIWVLFNKSIDPNMYVDHIDGNRSNNKIDNLRLVDHATNLRNMGGNKQNTTGVTGVSRNKHAYVAQWNTLEGKPVQESFSITRYGPEEAFRLACDRRFKMMQELNDSGAGYTDRHIKLA